MPCEECEKLWRAYENAVFEHVRLCSRLKLALATNADDLVCEDLAGDVRIAEGKRGAFREALLKHEAATGHGATVAVAKRAI